MHCPVVLVQLITVIWSVFPNIWYANFLLSLFMTTFRGCGSSGMRVLSILKMASGWLSKSNSSKLSLIGQSSCSSSLGLQHLGIPAIESPDQRLGFLSKNLCHHQLHSLLLCKDTSSLWPTYRSTMLKTLRLVLPHPMLYIVTNSCSFSVLK